MLGLPRSHWERDEPSWLQPEVREIDSALCLRLALSGGSLRRSECPLLDVERP